MGAALAFGMGGDDFARRTFGKALYVTLQVNVLAGKKNRIWAAQRFEPCGCAQIVEAPRGAQGFVAPGLTQCLHAPGF